MSASIAGRCIRRMRWRSSQICTSSPVVVRSTWPNWQTNRLCCFGAGSRHATGLKLRVGLRTSVQRVLLESGAPQATIALAGSGYGVAIVPSTVQIPQGRVRAMALVQRDAAVGACLRIAWDPQRFLAPYAQRFVDELVPYCQGVAISHETSHESRDPRSG